MATQKQILGQWGELWITKCFNCPKCKRKSTLRRLPTNFKCADIICDFCGYLAQVKAMTVKNLDTVPKSVLGAAWSPQKERMKAGIYFPLFLVLKSERNLAIYPQNFRVQVSLRSELHFQSRQGELVGKGLRTISAP